MPLPRGRSLRAMEQQAALLPGPGPVEVIDVRDESGVARKSSPAAKGQLQFSGDFEGGNLGTVRVVSDFEYELSIRPDSGNPKYRLWFHFKVSNCKAGQRVLFSIMNFSKQRSLFREGMSPLVSSSTRPRWERIPPKNCFYYRSPKTNNAYVLSFVFVFDREQDKYAFAYSYPFTYTHQQRLLAELEWRQLPYVRRHLLCRSVQQRRVDVLLITNPDSNSAPPAARKKRAVVVCARVHPGETPASHCVTGFINYVVSNRPEVQALREEVLMIVVPMLNPDGTFLGNYRTCSLGTDLNRMWIHPGAQTEPTLKEIKDLIRLYHDDEDTQLDFFVDIHAHSTASTGFLLCNPPPDKGDFNGYERAAIFPRIFASQARDFSLGACKFCDDPSKAGSGRRALGDILPDTMCYTLELSFFPTSGNQATTLLSEEGYMEFGQHLGQAFVEYYRQPGILAGQSSRSSFQSHNQPPDQPRTSESHQQPFSPTSVYNSSTIPTSFMKLPHASSSSASSGRGTSTASSNASSTNRHTLLQGTTHAIRGQSTSTSLSRNNFARPRISSAKSLRTQLGTNCGTDIHPGWASETGSSENSNTDGISSSSATPEVEKLESGTGHHGGKLSSSRMGQLETGPAVLVS